MTRARHNQRVGRWGERLAEQFLRRRGYTIVEQNYSFRGGELDIVARRGDEWLFAEVKTRLTTDSGYPEEAFGYVKRRRTERAVGHYLYHRGIETENWHIGLVCVRPTGPQTVQIRLLLS